MKKNLEKVWRVLRYQGTILARGLVKTVFGAATAGALAMAGYGFWMIPSEGGYTAVCEFVAAIATLWVALSCVYVQGGGRRKKGAKG